MTRKLAFSVVVLGLVQYVLMMVTIFVVSLIFGVTENAEMTAPPPLGMAVVTVLMLIMSYAFGRRLKLIDRKQQVMTGLVWSGMTTVFLVATLLANDTGRVFLGSWVSYLVFIAQAIGMLIVRPSADAART